MPLHPALTLSLYSGVILISALGGALVTAVRGLSGQTNSLLAFAAGVMLGAAFFHLLPEALHQGGLAALPWVVGGFVALLLLERFAGAHACEEPPDCPQHGHGLTLGLTALLGLCAHTLFDGIALGASVSEGLGLTAVTAITAHKLPSSLSLAAILKSEGKRLPTILRYVAILALMVPLGAAV
ncbi:MAG TPA: ZIP family metal transporter, partial [Myxococcaceae bacterium]|nr:ZIP family metal transporter [Myxococcaceae bacterium]